MLAFAFLLLSAKPVSIRRLSLLFVFSFVSARCLVSIIGVRDLFSLTLPIAIGLTVLFWAWPLMRSAYGTLFTGRSALAGLNSVSECVQFTYGFTLLIIPATAVEVLLSAPHALAPSLLIRAIMLACAGGVGFAILIQSCLASVRRTKRNSWCRQPCNHCEPDTREVQIQGPARLRTRAPSRAAFWPWSTVRCVVRPTSAIRRRCSLRVGA